MPDGFVGKASEKYLEALAIALFIATVEHNHDPFTGCHGDSPSPPSLPFRNNQPTPYEPDSARSGSHATRAGNKTNIAADQSSYNSILKEIRETDAQVANELYSVMMEINELCETVYIIPITKPRYLSIMNYVKNSLSEFLTLTNHAETETNNFVEKIIDIG